MSVRTARVPLGPRLAILAAICCASAPAFAEPAGNIDLNVFRPAIDSRGYLTVNASQVLGDKEFSFGLGALDWGHHLLKFDDGTNTYSIDNIISATLIAAFGIHAGPAELEFGASIPLTIATAIAAPTGTNDTDPNNDHLFRLDGQGLGNVGLHFKTRFIKTSRPPHVGLGVIASVYLPSVNPTDRFLGEAKGAASGKASSKFVPQVIGILDKEFGATGALRIAINGGIGAAPRRSRTTYDRRRSHAGPGKSITAAPGSRSA
jgi:hypothetical protein